MTISERVFERLSELSMTQKEFSKRTGILQSTISEWKKNKTNPSSDKIMIICEVLDVSPEWLLSGVDETRKRGKERETIVISKYSDDGEMLRKYLSLNPKARERIMGFVEAVAQFAEDKNKS